MVKSSWDDADWIWNYEILLFLEAIINIVGSYDASMATGVGIGGNIGVVIGSRQKWGQNRGKKRAHTGAGKVGGTGVGIAAVRSVTAWILSASGYAGPSSARSPARQQHVGRLGNPFTPKCDQFQISPAASPQT